MIDFSIGMILVPSVLMGSNTGFILNTILPDL
jgi:uncharacterized membrane protein required for colicin V production